MKKISNFILVIGFTSLACNDNLDLQPQQAISTEVALSTEQGIRTALVGAYDLLTESNTFGGDVLLNSELLIDADNLFWTNFFADPTQIFEKEIPVANTVVAGYWINAYQVINQVNSILNAIEVIPDNNRAAILAEARFLRGMVYFDLVNLFAKTWGDGSPENNLGVPIVELPSEQALENPMIPRNTVAEVYQFIIVDLQFAKANLPATNGVFATTYAASALLSRVYLMQEAYDFAATEADRVIESGLYALLPEVSSFFDASENTAETIFALQFTAQDWLSNICFFYTGELEGGGGFVGITDEHMVKYEAGDQRSALFYLDAQSGTRRTAKWQPNATNDRNVTLIRLAEMYLTRAEGLFRQGAIAGALADVNKIRNRVGLPLLTDSEITLETILKERFLELVFEGHQFRDTKRTRQSVRDLPFNDTRLIYPIPQRELDVNAALVQNEGY